MRVILISGPIASGKTAIGTALADKLNAMGKATIFMDLDEEVLKIHGSFVWKNSEERTKYWLEARRRATANANKAIAEGQNVVVSGPFYLRDEILGLTGHLRSKSQVLLYTLEVPLMLRLERNRGRASASPEEQMIDQDAAIKSLSIVYGSVIENNGSEKDTVAQLLRSIAGNVGRL